MVQSINLVVAILVDFGSPWLHLALAIFINFGSLGLRSRYFGSFWLTGFSLFWFILANWVLAILAHFGPF